MLLPWCKEWEVQRMSPWHNWPRAGLRIASDGSIGQLCAAPIPMIIQSDHLQLHKDDEQGGTAGPVNRNEGMDNYGRTQART